MIAARPDPPTATSVLALVQSIERRDPAAPAALAFKNALLRAGLEIDATGGLAALEAIADAVAADDPSRAGARLTVLRAAWAWAAAETRREGQTMTPREQAAFAAGIETARQMALTAAVTIEVRADAKEVRQQAAAAALQGLAEGLRGLTVTAPSTCISAAFAGQPVEPEAIDSSYDGRVVG